MNGTNNYKKEMNYIKHAIWQKNSNAGISKKNEQGIK